jgi:hypothetical protein
LKPHRIERRTAHTALNPASVRRLGKLVPLGAMVFCSALASAADMPAVTADVPARPASRWDAAFASFAADDAAHPHPPGGVLFVGSSSIRMWTDLESRFTAAPVVIKRGFGGSQLSDCVKHLSRLVLPYRPRTVLVYAGDNDLAAGTPPQEVYRRFLAFVDGVHRELPQTHIAYISIKPSPARAQLLGAIRETNGLIREYAEREDSVDYVDVFTPMLDAEGRPRAELFRADRLHLNGEGYALWQRVIAPHVH